MDSLCVFWDVPQLSVADYEILYVESEKSVGFCWDSSMC